MTDRDKVESALINAGIFKYCTVKELTEIACSLIANGVTVNEWRPASDPPKEEGSYLVYSCKSKTVFTARYRPRCERWANRANGQFITHWMPLPQPPKGVE